jgi:aspartyl-tRNA(Asn)/glutamyl-tRNA(Gln) amidotransferase subunit C
MEISRPEVEKIARLARLKLTAEETKRYQSQLAAILDYINQLNEAKTEGVPITAQVTGQTNVLADDEIVNKPQTDSLLKGAPLREKDSIKVKAVFDEPNG